MANGSRSTSTVGRWSRRGALVALALFAMLVAPPVLAAAGTALGETGSQVALLLVGDVVLVLLCRALLRRWGRAPRLALGAVPGRRQLASCAALAVGTLGVACGAMWCTSLVLHWLAPEAAAFLLDDELPLLSQSPTLATSIALDAVIVAPVLEEWLFRGVLLPRWSQRFGTVRSVALTSALFGLLHVNPVGAAVFAWIAALLYRRTRSLWAPIVFHAVHNALVVGAAVLTGADQPTASEVAAWWPSAAAATVLGAAVVAVWVRTGVPTTHPIAPHAA